MKIIMTLHTDYAHYVFGRYKNMKLLRAFVSFLGKVYYRNADVVILPSEKATGYPQVEKVREKLAIVPNGIKLERLQKTLFPAEKQVLMRKYGLTAGKVLVIVSRLSREKNILFLLKAFPLILRKDPAVKLLIVGD